MRPSGTMSFAPEGDGTRLEFEMAMNPRGVMKLMNSLIERRVQRTNDQHLERFQQILETS
jgi:hypothetical protein